MYTCEMVYQARTNGARIRRVLIVGNKSAVCKERDMWVTWVTEKDCEYTWRMHDGSGCCDCKRSEMLELPQPGQYRQPGISFNGFVVIV